MPAPFATVCCHLRMKPEVGIARSLQSEVLRTEAAFLPGLRAELDSLRRRHTSALELMGERDEEVCD